MASTCVHLFFSLSLVPPSHYFHLQPWTRHMPPLKRGNLNQPKVVAQIAQSRCPESLPPEWIQIKVLRSPGNPRNRLPMQKKQHPLHPIFPLGKEKDVVPIQHQQEVQQQPTKIIAVSVWRICRWIVMHFHAWHAAEKQFIYIAKTNFLEVV